MSKQEKKSEPHDDDTTNQNQINSSVLIKRMFEKSKSVCFTTLATEKLLRKNLGFGICDRAPESHLRLKQTLFKQPLKLFTMKERKTSRLLLFDLSNRLLLMKVNDSSVCDLNALVKSDFWCTVGGRMKEGETVFQTAIREAKEETGLNETEIEIGSAVWYGEQVLNWKGEPTLMRETFIVARTQKTLISDEGRTASENRVIKSNKWWTLDELLSTEEIIRPPVLVKLLPAVINRQYPHQTMTIDL